MKRIPLVDLTRQHRELRSEIEATFRSIVDAERYILGPNVQTFEQEMASYLGVGHALAVANGTDALLLALRALKVGRGDEVILPAFTFVSTAEVVLHAGATPVYADIDPETFVIKDPPIRKKTKALITVHLFGHPAPTDFPVPVIEDGAQSFGAQVGGRKVLSIGRINATSFYPTKNLGGWGDGGMIFTGDARLADQVRLFRNHGWTRMYYPTVAGYNSRLDELQAAVLRTKLKHVDRWNAERRAAARRYDEMLKGLVTTPRVADGCTHVYHLYCIRTRKRDRVMAALKNAQIDCGVYYPVPIPKTAAFRSRGKWPVAEKVARDILAIPIFPGITPEEQSRVVEAIRSAT